MLADASGFSRDHGGFCRFPLALDRPVAVDCQLTNLENPTVASESRRPGVSAAPSARDLAVRRLRDLLRLEALDAAVAGRSSAPLPAEEVLMARLSVRREIVRDVLRLLVEDGVLVRRRGLGTRIAGDPEELSVALPAEHSPLGALLGAGTVSPQVLGWYWVEAPAAIASRLDGVSAGDHCLCIDYIFLRSDVPIAVVTNYLRAKEARGLTEREFTTDFYTLIGRVADGGLGSHDMTFECGRADAYVATLLEVEVEEPTTKALQVIKDSRGEAIDVAVIHFRMGVRLRVQDISVDALVLESPTTNPPAGST